MRLGELETALDVLDGLHRTHPSRKDVCYLLGVANRRLGRLDEAFEYLQRAEDLGWPQEDVTRQRYMARFQAGDIAGTKEYLERLIVKGADDAVAEELYEALAKGFLAEYRVGDAAVVLDHWIAWRPQAVQPRVWRSQLFEDNEDWNGAAEQYRKIVEIDPSSLSAHLGLADSLLILHKVGAAHRPGVRGNPAARSPGRARMPGAGTMRAAAGRAGRGH